MVAALVDDYGTHTLSAETDDEGHFTATVAYLVRCDLWDGPLTILNCPGLPLFGDSYQFKFEASLWAFCRPGAKATPYKPKDGEATRFYLVEKTFSTKPLKKCASESFENPLLQPQKVSGSFSHSVIEATHDRFGVPITTSSWERIRGKEVEVELQNPEVVIEQNVIDLELPLLSRVNGTLNDAPLWGLPRRCVRCVVTGWEQKFYGVCSMYYTRKLKFTTNVKRDTTTGILVSHWDRTVLDEGTKCLVGSWHPTNGTWVLRQVGGEDPSPHNPAHFGRFKDMTSGENAKCILDGAGVPVNKRIMGAITNITGDEVSPIVVTSDVEHGLEEGDTVGVFGFEGTNYNAMGIFIAEVQSPTTFGLFLIAPEDVDQETELATEGNGDYVSGGYWVNLSNGPGQRRVELLDEANFLALGIPVDLNFTS